MPSIYPFKQGESTHYLYTSLASNLDCTGTMQGRLGYRRKRGFHTLSEYRSAGT